MLANSGGNAVILKRGVVHIVDDDVPNGHGNATANTTPPAGAASFSAAQIAGATRAATFWSALSASDPEEEEIGV